MTNSENKEQPTEKILRVAKRLFAKDGFYKTDRTTITTEAHVGGGEISIRFKDKENVLKPKEMILVELLERKWENINQSIKTRKTADVMKKLRGILWAILDAFEKDREFKIIFIAHSHELYKLGERLMQGQARKLVQTIESILAEGQEREIFTKELTPKSMQRIFFGVIEEFVHSHTLKETVGYVGYDRQNSPEQLKKTIDTMLFALLKKSQLGDGTPMESGGP